MAFNLKVPDRVLGRARSPGASNALCKVGQGKMGRPAPQVVGKGACCIMAGAGIIMAGGGMGGAELAPYRGVWKVGAGVCCMGC